MLKLIHGQAPTTRQLSEAVAASNLQVARLNASLGVPETALSCECGEPTCRERISVSAEEYELLVEEGRPLLALRHYGAPMLRT